MFKHLFVLLAVVALLFAGCAKAPNDLLEKTQTALDNAKAAEADLYFPLKFLAVRDSVSVAIAEIENVKTKFFLSRNYDHAERLLLQAFSELNGLTEKTALKKEETKLEVQQMIIDISTQITEARATMPLAKKIRKNRDFVKSCEVEVIAVESEIAILKQLVEQGEYLTAWNKATANLEKLNQINIDLKTSLSTTSAKKARILG